MKAKELCIPKVMITCDKDNIISGQLAQKNGGVLEWEVCLLTNDVVKLADFYKRLLSVDNESNDNVHQTIIAEETMLTIHNDGTKKNNCNHNICIAFTVDDVDLEYKRILDYGMEIIDEPITRPWGARNMSFYDIDKNMVFLRSFSSL